MSSPYEVLGIGPEADERDIKRAYARLLKKTRPDDDPEGFQRLNEAYQAALRFAQTRWPEAGDEAVAGIEAGEEVEAASYKPALPELDGDTAPDINPAILRVEPLRTFEPVEPKRTPQFGQNPANPARFLFKTPEQQAGGGASSPKRVIQPYELARECVRQAEEASSAQALLDRLEDNEALWDLTVKANVAKVIESAVYAEASAIDGAVFDALLAFFGRDGAEWYSNPFTRIEKRARLDSEYQLTKGDQSRLYKRWYEETNRANTSGEAAFVAAVSFLKTPFSQRKAFLYSIGFHEKPRLLFCILKWITQNGTKPLPASIDQEHYDYWTVVGNHTRISVARLKMHLTNWLIIYGAIWVLLSFMMLASNQPKGVLIVVHGALAWAFSVWVLWTYVSKLFSWQAKPEQKLSRRESVWHWGFLPFLLAAWLVLYATVDHFFWRSIPFALSGLFFVIRLGSQMLYRHGRTLTEGASRAGTAFGVVLFGIYWIVKALDHHVGIGDFLPVVFMSAFIAIDTAYRRPLAMLRRDSDH
ncbi:J domain-containing protein [Hydrogenophaga sp. 5NK40-0174]|uniref:J domain-containing protein n=1 Tax=Hydrogenophaga sp. 5NK40-0174 TaxID=3127649 RepID=UPI0031098589